MANCQRVAIQNRDFRHEGFHRGHPQDADAKRPRPPASVASAQKAAAAAAGPLAERMRPQTLSDLVGALDWKRLTSASKWWTKMDLTWFNHI